MTSPIEVVVNRFHPSRGLSGLCAGFEQGDWRAEALSAYLTEFLPEFCLSYGDLNRIGPANAVLLLRQAAERVYKTNKFENRGEFGELLLHAAMKDLVHTIPAVSKIYYKDSANDTVKGFDAVHVVPSDEGLELWLGEVKLYTDISKAIYDSSKELAQHLEAVYLRSEFLAIQNKIDDSWPHAAKLRELLDGHVSLDKIFSRLAFAVLLAYDGATCAQFDKHCDEYFNALKTEFEEINKKFLSANAKIDLKLHLILLPMKTKEKLVLAMDKRLRSWQGI